MNLAELITSHLSNTWYRVKVVMEIEKKRERKKQEIKVIIKEPETAKLR